MPSNSQYQKDYTEFNDAYQLVLPLSLEKMIPEDDSVRLLSHVLSELDYTELYRAYSSEGRKPGLEPVLMFKIMVYAYSQQIYSSRRIEEACRRDINFLWLLAGNKAPDHCTIARFRTHFLSGVCEGLFAQLNRKLIQRGEVSGETLFIDGTKIESKANKYTFVWSKVINKNEERMHEKIRERLERVNREFVLSLTFEKGSEAEDLQKIAEDLQKIMDRDDIQEVHGIGHRKTQIQKDRDYFRECLERQNGYDISHKLLQRRNSYSKTDPDATFMHMKDDHMRNAQLKPGYNIQIGVDSEYIMGMEVFSDRNDANTLIPFLSHTEELLGTSYPSVTADSGYENEETYLWLEKNGKTPYIKPQTYELWKKWSFKKDISRRENMTYLEEGDCYVCAQGRILWNVGRRTKTSVTGYRSYQKTYRCESCEGCPYYGGKCTRSKKDKTIQVSPILLEKRGESLKNILTDTGIRYRMNRSIQVEGAFGVLKNDYRFHRFLTAGKTNVKTEFLLLCLGYNINKLHSKIQNERQQQYFHAV